MDEATGCRILREQFTQAGLTIHENYPLNEPPICFGVDGFDPQQRIGYEYITTEAGDRSEITADLVAALEQEMAAGKLYIFLVDELDIDGPDELRSAAAQFITHVKSLRGSAP